MHLRLTGRTLQADWPVVLQMGWLVVVRSQGEMPDKLKLKADIWRNHIFSWSFDSLKKKIRHLISDVVMDDHAGRYGGF